MPNSHCTLWDKNDQKKWHFLTQGINYATGKMLNSEKRQDLPRWKGSATSATPAFHIPWGVTGSIQKEKL